MKKQNKPIKRSIKIEVKRNDVVHEFEIKQLFIGIKTVVLITCFIISGVVLGRSVWEYLITYFGLLATLIISSILFIFSGMSLRKFNNK